MSNIYILKNGEWKLGNKGWRDRSYSEARDIADLYNSREFNDKIYWVADSKEELPEPEEAVQEVRTS